MSINAGIEKILKVTIFVGLFGVLFLPFVIDRSLFFPFITGKGFSFRIIVEIIFAVWLILAAFKKEYRPKKSYILFSIGTFLLSLTISAIFSENPYKSFWSNFERMEGLITIVHLFLYFVVAGTMIHTEKLWTRFFNVSLSANALLDIYAFFQLAGALNINQGGVRVDGTLGNATYLAIYIVFHIFLALFLFFRTKNIYIRISYGVLTMLNLYILYETQTRGAILGLLGGLLLASLLIVWREKNDTIAKNYARIALITVVVLVGGFIAFRNTNFVQNNPTLIRFAQISIADAKNQARYYVWPMTIKGFLERPIFGWGQESFNYVFNKYYDSRLYAQEQWFDRAHNTVLDWLIAGGLVGLILYLSIFVFSLRFLWKTPAFSARDKSILTGLLAAYFLHNLFVFDNLTSYILFFSVLAYIYSTTSSKEKRILESHTFSQTASQFIAPITIVVLVFTLYFANARPIFAGKALIEAITPHNDGDVSKNLEAFKRALNYNTFGDREIREYLAKTTNSIVSMSEVPSDIKNSFANLAQAELDKQLEKTPEDTRYLVFAGVLANGLGKYDQAISYLEHAKETSPGKQTIYFEMGTSYLRKGDYDKALEAFKTAYELAPDFENAHIIYVVGAIYAKQDSLAKELLNSLPEYVYYFDDRILRAYVDRGDYQTLLPILGKRIEEEPNNVQYRITLAAVYLNMGNRTKAIAELQKAIEIEPSFKEQGEYYINEIKAGRNP